jgi:hypothetical protein
MRLGWTLGLALLVQPSASATTFHDEATGLSVDISVPGAAVCFARPKSLRGDFPACGGLDREALAELPPSVSLYALVRFPDWSFFISGTRGPPTLHAPMSRANARDVLKWWTGPSSSFTTQQPDFLVVNDVQVLRFEMLSSAKGTYNAFLNYLVAGTSGLLVVGFLTDTAHLSRVKVIAESTIASVDMPHAAAPASWMSGPESAGYDLGVLAAQIGLELVALGVLCACGVFLYRLFRGGPTNR